MFEGFHRNSWKLVLAFYEGYNKLNIGLWFKGVNFSHD